MSLPDYQTSRVVAVDLDGTLLKADLSWELLMAYLRARPWRLFCVLGWVSAGGLVRLKSNLAERVLIEGEHLPWNDEVIDWCEQHAQKGGRVVLATASPLKAAQSITGHFKFITEVLGSDEVINLKAQAKADALTFRFGHEGFDYIGNSSADLPVWRAAQNAFFVGTESVRNGFQHRLEAKRLIPITGGSDRLEPVLLAALRPHQWLKNLLILVPLLGAHRWNDPACWWLIGPALLALCCVASATYILNDLTDLESDRRHPRKKRRAFASGQLGIPTGLLFIGVLLFTGGALALVSGLTALAAVSGYVILSIAYSLGLKKIAIVDVVWLSCMYTYRVLIGGAITGVVVSSWLLAYTISLFLGLAFLKRYVELGSSNAGESVQVPGRGYDGSDASRIRAGGIAAGLVSTVVLGFYLRSPASIVLYADPRWLWVVVLAMAGWLARIWIMAGHKKVDDDPVWFAAKDPVTWLISAVCIAALMLAGPL
ncbi:UbiA family prenyltransferase [Rariglobus hedericola]|uniref:UbiA family prenyltransferase n=1 Tax=Rariglobus hedericola TaxID=2597822 RepID=A0A556QNG5_9BACT|nr:UbiA family prenyltransferase [Rariglobus hedericola]TSJ78190.1 UbiA family prenyltransferase [Rariglobus hedericola]